LDTPVDPGRVLAVRTALLGLVATLVAVAGCSRPQPPTLIPEKATITTIGPGGIGVLLDIGIENPNSIDLAGRSLTAKVVLDKTHDLGTITVPNGLALPAKKRTPLSVPMTLPWKDLTTILALAGQARDIPYDVDGSLTVGGETFHADVPFHLSGSVSHQQLVQAAANSLPRLFQ
jgi:hypothetical protein